MEFTYKAYSKLLELLRAHHYSFCNYQNYRDFDRCVIMRHDIDYNIEQAVRLAQAEADFGIQSTYFVLLSSDFYNPASISSYKALHSIVDLGHNIGLHFDETVYNYDHRSMEYYISKEARILSELLEVEINSFSLHRPNAVTLETELEIPGFVNSYSKEFFQNFKYVSDSRRRWREPVEEIIQSEAYRRLHILTHAFWYHQEERSLKGTISDFIKVAGEDRRTYLSENITDLDSILK